MSFEKTKKETLTDDLIKKDLIYHLKNHNHIAINIFLFAVSIFVVFLFSFITYFAWFIVLIPALLILLWYIELKKKIKEIENGKFIVILDELLYEKQGELRTKATFYKGKWISYLQFSNNGRWEVEGYYYTWSDTYKMSGTGICNTSNCKDIFYIVLDKSTQKIAMGYNTKFFDYKI